MMSIFSPFDAFSAESSGWKLFNFSSSSSSATQFDRKSSASSATAANAARNHEICLRRESVTPVKKDGENLNKVDDRSWRKPVPVTKKRNPRFAVELDGVHCFETIIPY